MNITELNALADQCICHSASRGIADVEAAGEGLKYLIAQLEEAQKCGNGAACCFKESKIESLESQLEDAQGEIRALRATEAGLLERVKELEEGLSSLLLYADKNTCTHEETYRGGAIWTICRACDAKWADDEGGMPEWEDPKELAAARALLEKQQ